MIGKLTEPTFEAEFYRTTPEGGMVRLGGALDGAQGVFFYCPCENHALMIPFSNPRGAEALPKGWAMSGTGLDDLTLTPSINVNASGPNGSCWHGWIRNGQVT